MEPSLAKRGFGRHIAIPHSVMRSSDYKNLSGSAVKLLNALVFQHNGGNNGDLTAAWSVMSRDHGFRSKDTLSRALKELQSAKLILRTRVSLFQNPNNRCALYAVTWLAIDECPGKHLDTKPTNTPVRKFSIEKT